MAAAMDVSGPVAEVGWDWTEAQVEGLVRAFIWPGSSFWSTMSDAVWVLVRLGTGPGGSIILGGRGGDPAYAVLQVVGGGAVGERSWAVWYLCDWWEREQVPSPYERQRLQEREAWLRELIRRDEEARRADPRRRPDPEYEKWKAELAEIEERLSHAGRFEVVVHLGYARRWGPNQYLLRV